MPLETSYFKQLYCWNAAAIRTCDAATTQMPPLLTAATTAGELVLLPIT